MIPLPESFAIICKVVNETPALQSLLYDLNLLPEQTADDATRWFYTDTTANHFIAYAAACVAEERERCAKVCEARQTPGTGSVAILDGAADAIRNLGFAVLAAAGDKA